MRLAINLCSADLCRLLGAACVTLLISSVSLAQPAGLLTQPGFDGQNAGNLFGGGAAPVGGEAPGAAGGGSLADFDSLMTLIQQTIEPDVWEALGGVSTMAPYPAGVMVTAEGLVTSIESLPDTAKTRDRAREISQLLSVPDSRSAEMTGAPHVHAGPAASADWRLPAKIRCVSMRRMMQRLAMDQFSSAREASSKDGPFDTAKLSLSEREAIASMAGLSKVTLLMNTPDDLILAGPVGGFLDSEGWQVDRLSGLPAMDLVSLAVGLNASKSKTPFGCTIDPTVPGLQAATSLGQRVASGEIPIGTAAEKLAEALGRQEVRVFGTTPTHQIAILMVEADRHMKQIALGDQPMPEGVRNYLQMIASTGDGTPPNDLLLRLWFTSKRLAIRGTRIEGGEIVQIAGTPLQLSGENELALISGQRGNVVVDPATMAFVRHFNDNWSSIRSRYPIYGALESIYHATAIAEFWNQMAVTSDHETLQRATLYFAAQIAPELTAPQKVDSIAVLHRYRRGNQRHSVLLASGGVKVAANDLLPKQSTSYAGLKAYSTLADQRPTDRWWWNATTSAPNPSPRDE